MFHRTRFFRKKKLMNSQRKKHTILHRLDCNAMRLRQFDAYAHRLDMDWPTWRVELIIMNKSLLSESWDWLHTNIKVFNFYNRLEYSLKTYSLINSTISLINSYKTRKENTEVKFKIYYCCYTDNTLQCTKNKIKLSKWLS